MAPLALPAIIQGVAGIGQLLGGAIGTMGTKRPEYQIPDALKQSLALAKINFQDPNMPGYTQAKEVIDLQTANLIRGAVDSGNAQQSIQQIAEAARLGSSDLARMNAEDQRRDQDQLNQILGKVAEAEDMQFQINEFGKFQDQSQRFADIFGAGLENVFGAADKGAMLGLLGGGGGAAGGAAGAMGMIGASAGKSASNPIGSLNSMLGSGSTEQLTKLLNVLTAARSAKKRG